jgi:hypothetical protein
MAFMTSFQFVTLLRSCVYTGRCPPEDVGGPWGYQAFREALADPAHERHAELAEWWGAKDCRVAARMLTPQCGFRTV